ncbi:beta-ketoacyl synthase N-terminal-like domain-containing protein [Kosakonia pseudosacchari]|uniref:beta-ketoacyl synthase N-terminal-like domain-containing protein n=1 Tax=Kosakonia pseudosacchari TaxID=1646340 RepID=UPI000A3A2C95|nr:beta-ketoacyl synthase N-terminal-like domain-containing protein [Kosakonia pseudosacchari]
MDNAAIIAGYSLYLPFAENYCQLINNLRSGKRVNENYWFVSEEVARKCGFTGNKRVARLEQIDDSPLTLLYRLIDEALAQANLSKNALTGERVRVYLTGLGPRVDGMDYKSFYDHNDVEDLKCSPSISRLHANNMSQDKLAYNIAHKYGLHYLPPDLHCTSNSSLTAVHLGCQAIDNDGADLICVINCSKIKTQDIWFLENQSMLDGESVQPFCQNSSSVLFSEGCCVILLESEKHRQARGVNGGIQLKSTYSQISASRSNDSAWLSANIIKVMSKILDEASIKLGDLCAIVPHGNGSSNSDKAEAKAIAMLSDKHSVPVLAYKGQLGYTTTGSGIVDLIIGEHSLRQRELLTPVSNDDIIEEIAGQLLTDIGVVKHEKKHLLKTGLGVDGSIIGIVMSDTSI